ncbi:hypothetical protein NUU61_005561 [Penicillium alfredii]|uniref:Zn(2)-C6 fungal-type domain-containing protein n=1 Tax=Penicillium alfredii TaxID=1506179 RepID=A0A9W9F9X0_9EURO|nr:uncharacterized protein NUU61_005561 [Penicillium alfredii]KAJ5096205.1 hypothetical protein NUU61_005561 [Penicillium alfredii]
MDSGKRGPTQPRSRGNAGSPALERPMRYPRKRAVTACQLCRARKTKCDNQRPSCRICLSVGVPCQYADRTDHSSFDPASLEIIDRLNRIIDTQEDVLTAVRATNTRLSQGPNAVSISESPLPSPHELLVCATRPGHELAADSFDVPSSNTSPDNILIWPVFEQRYPEKCLQDAVFASSSQTPRMQRTKFAFQEDKVPALMDRFFYLVHIKNPIVDEESLRHDARKVIEDGLGWDEGSCLVLLACALGTLAVPFRDSHQMASLNPEDYPMLPKLLGPLELEEAETYLMLARRRIGTLSQSVATVQCYFLSGVFFMYTFRPLDAFQSFHQASVMYQVYSRSKGESVTNDTDPKTEQRLFWSCFKSECEILSEIDLPHSGVSHLGYIHVFPCPPDAYTTGPSPRSIFSPGGREQACNPSPHEQEQAWFYYLSEIALRRIGNRVLDSFYKEGFQAWIDFNVPSMMQVANEFLRQLNQWYECLPSQMRFDDSRPGVIPNEELPYLLYTRLQEIRSWIFRPFLYLAIHLPSDNIHLSSLGVFVEESLYCSTRLIEGNSICHRHHGTWYMLRLSVASALSLIAAARRNLEMSGWRGTVELAVENLRYWENGAPGDIVKARVILEHLLSGS